MILYTYQIKEVTQMKKTIEKKLDQEVYKRKGTGSMKGITLYTPKTKSFDWNKIQELKKELTLEFCSVNLIGVLS